MFHVRETAKKLTSVLLLLSALACASVGLGGDTQDVVLFQIDNRSWNDVRVYMERSTGFRQIVTRVGAMSKAEREFPWTAAYETPFHLVAVALGGGEEMHSATMSLGPGDEVVWEIQNEFQWSWIRYAPPKLVE